MSNELTVVNQGGNALSTQNNAGSFIDFSNPLLRLQPATITLVQNNTSKEGAVPGNLILDNGDQYKEMTVALLAMPTIIRQYHGPIIPGTLTRTPENLQCFSYDDIAPHEKAKNPQAMKCANCIHQDWHKYQQTKSKADIPPCDRFYKAILVDTVFQMPLRLFARSKAKEAFEKDAKNLARELYKLKVTKKIEPNFFDIKFKLSARKIITNKLPSYVFSMTNFEPITDEDREAFGEVYKMFVEFSRNQPAGEGDSPVFDQDAAEAAVNSVVLDGTYEPIKDDEIPF
jgi:hypothetical protein